MATILTKKKDTTGAPATGDLTNSSGGAELAVNTADKRLYTKNSSNAVVEIGTNPGTAVTFVAGTASDPAITTTGDTNTGIFFPAADTIAFAEGGAEAMRITSDGFVGLGTGTPSQQFTLTGSQLFNNNQEIRFKDTGGTERTTVSLDSSNNLNIGTSANGNLRFINGSTYTERMRIDSSGVVGIGTSSPVGRLEVVNTSAGASAIALRLVNGSATSNTETVLQFQPNVGGSTRCAQISGKFDGGTNATAMLFYTNLSGGSPTERARITSGGVLTVGTTDVAPGSANLVGVAVGGTGYISASRESNASAEFNRKTDDGDIIIFRQAGTQEGSISVSGSTISYNAFCGGHWTQLQEGRGYNPDIPRGTVMSSIGDMAVWKSVEWTETIEHPAIEAVEAVEAVLDEDGNVIEPAVEAVEGKEAWTESIPHRESYLGNLDIGATFEEDGFTKTVVDDGNERLPKVKISDVVGDKAVYGVFQTWDEVEDMLVSSLGAFVVRVASGVTVEVGDLLESNGDGCAKVQDDDIIRSKTIGKVTSTVATATYDDGSYTVPCVLYCG
jgi:hypothetical protein